MDSRYELNLGVFQTIPDPKVERTKMHGLEFIMFIALCTYITGGQSFHDMQLFAQTREDWLKEKIGMVSVPVMIPLIVFFKSFHRSILGNV